MADTRSTKEDVMPPSNLALCTALLILIPACQQPNAPTTLSSQPVAIPATLPELAAEVRAETLRTWNDYKQYAWGYDVLLPLSRQGHNWYEQSLGISPFDAYSALKVMGLHEQAREIEQYALTMNWNKDVFVQVFEVNIRILGGLLSMYHYSGNPAILAKARDFADRLMPAFDSPTGIPYHSVNLRTGKTAGDRGKGTGEVVNVAQAATYLLEFGILSYYTEDLKYYQAAKRATIGVFKRRTEIGLIGENINVRTGEWVGERWSHLQACVDAYYEYIYKTWDIFPDPDLKSIWNHSIYVIEKYLGEEYNGRYYYTIVNMDTGKVVKRSVSLYDAFFPAIQALSGDIPAAERNQRSWHALWMQYGLLPTRYRYDLGEPEFANYDLNPEIIESAYYLQQLTGKPEYEQMLRTYWRDLKKHCRGEVGFHAIEDVRTMQPKDYMATYFIAETLKYLYIGFAGKEVFDFEAHIFNTEAHTFRRDAFDTDLARQRLGF